MLEQLIVDSASLPHTPEDYDILHKAIHELSSASQDQFDEIKREKWYHRVFDMVTFSQKGKKRLAEQISTVAQAQQILLELLLRLSENDNAISGMVRESFDDLKKLGEQNIYLLDRIKKLENAALGLYTDTDIHNFSQKEKQILCACLYKISETSTDSSDQQQEFANFIVLNLNTNVQMDKPFEALSKLEYSSRKKIIICCLEYMYLKTCSNNSYDDYESFIDELDIGSKTLKIFQAQINALYKLRGKAGFLEPFYEETSGKTDEIFEIDFDFTPEEDDLYTEISDEYISSLLYIPVGQEKTFQYQNVHIQAYINCEGNLSFDHCTLVFDEAEKAGQIILNTNSCLSITNSTIICKGYIGNDLIIGKGHNKVSIISSTLLDCMHLVHLVNCLSFNLKNCKVENCWEGFVNVLQEKEANTSCEISNNLFSLNNLPKGANQNIYTTPSCNIIAIEGNNFIFDNNAFIEAPGILSVPQNTDIFNIETALRGVVRPAFKYIYTETVPITNCKFIGTTLSIHATNVENCVFQKCDCCIHCHQNCKINNCKFEECTNIIFLSANTKISNCQFNSCFDNIINSRSGFYSFGGCDITFCQFNNITASKRNCIIFSNSNNHMHACTFDGVTINSENLYLITSYYSDNQNDPITYIDNCIFKSCSTKQQENKIILETIPVNSFLKKHLLCINRISNCHGLDSVQHIGEQADKTSDKRVIRLTFDGKYM